MVPINELVTTDVESRSLPYRRLLEVTKRMYIPVYSTTQALITSNDVIHS
jgi:heme/copper-type cytochrome/quinol oxidase subunit 2